MTQQDIFDVIVRHTRDVLPNLADHTFQSGDSLKALGANSVDRADIIMMTLETLALNVPLVEMARADISGNLAEIMYAKA